MSSEAQTSVEQLQDHAHVTLRRYMHADDVRFGRTMMLIAQLRNVEQKRVRERYFTRFHAESFEDFLVQSMGAPDSNF